MKKAFAILFLLIIAFNLFGYHLLISFLQKRADQKLEAFIDHNNFNEAELVELRVQLNMPYQYRFTEFERHYGQIQINGTAYNYVKSKIEGDVLVLLCLPNHFKTQLKQLAATITKANNDSGAKNDAPVKEGFKLFSFECDDFLGFSALTQPDSKTASCFNYQENYDSWFADTPHQPPGKFL